MADGAHEQLRLGASQRVALHAAQHCVQSERIGAAAVRSGTLRIGRGGAGPALTRKVVGSGPCRSASLHLHEGLAVPY